MRPFQLCCLASIVAVSGLAFVACGGDGDSDSPPGASGQGGAAGGGGTGGWTPSGGTGGVGGTGGAAGAAGSETGGTAGAAGSETGGTAGAAGVAGAGGGSTCTPGSTESCYSGPDGTEGQGVCHAGTQVCNAQGTGYGPCEGEVVPSAEDCTTPEDEDCDGQTPACASVVADLRVDNNRNGTIDLTDATEDANEQTWDSTHGAIFLANIDDDDESCSTSGSDSQLAACHDASNTTIDGADDLLDLARMKTVPWAAAPDDASGTLQLSSPGADYVRLFKGSGSSFAVFDPNSDALSAAELRSGVEFAIEGMDVVRDASVWDGYVDITLNVDGGASLSDGDDTVRMRLAPMLLRHHLDDADTVYATSFNYQESLDFRTDLSAAISASGMSNSLYRLYIDDQWTQDVFETAYMSMPAAGGTQKVIHVNIRSANYSQNQLREGGRVVYTTLRGEDTAGLTQYDPSHPNSMDSLNSFGNAETIPPYDLNGESYPDGRIIRGATSTYYPDESVDTMFASQGAQSPVELDTEWLLVGHVDETISFFKASTPRGWGMMINDAPQAKQMLQEAQADGYGSTRMFVGLYDYDNNPAQVSISATLSDTDLMNVNAWAAVEVESQKTYLKQITGLTDAEIVGIPFLWTQYYGYAVAYQPGMANGIMLADNHFAPPDPHGPYIQGEDIFKAMVENTLAANGVTVHWVEDWYLYHILDGEVHCGSNTKRVVPDTHRWWEGG